MHKVWIVENWCGKVVSCHTNVDSALRAMRTMFPGALESPPYGPYEEGELQFMSNDEYYRHLGHVSCYTVQED